MEGLVSPKRLWMLAGVTVTDVAGADPGYTLNDLPIFSMLPFRYLPSSLHIFVPKPNPSSTYTAAACSKI